MHRWRSTGKPAEDASTGELAAASRRQGGVESLGDVIELSIGPDRVK